MGGRGRRERMERRRVQGGSREREGLRVGGREQRAEGGIE